MNRNPDCSTGRSIVNLWRDAIFEADTTPEAKLLCLAISYHMAPDGSSAFPGRKRLAKLTNYSLSTVKRHLRRAEADGLLYRSRSSQYTPYDYRPGFPGQVAAGMEEKPSPETCGKVAVLGGHRDPPGGVTQTPRGGHTDPRTRPPNSSRRTRPHNTAGARGSARK